MFFIKLPFSIFSDDLYSDDYSYNNLDSGYKYIDDISTATINDVTTNNISSNLGISSSSKSYSSTNIQVENVDEADITKTDGDYIYSISDNNVIITNVINPKKIKIEATINSLDESIPEDLVLYNNKLVIISSTGGSRYRYSKNNTIIRIYDISTKSLPKLVKNYELYEPYYTSRRIEIIRYCIRKIKSRKEKSN